MAGKPSPPSCQNHPDAARLSRTDSKQVSAYGASPWEPHPTESVCSEGTPHRKGGVEAQDTRPMRRSFRTRGFFAGEIPRVCTLGWYAMPRQGMGFETGLGHGIGNGLTLRQNGIEPDTKRSAKRSARRLAPRPGSAKPVYRRSRYETTGQAAKPPL